jgi:hypothetical protein
MELHPVLQVIFLGVVGVLAAIAILWFYASYGAWMDDAFENGRWIWFGLLLLFTFPASLIAWLIMRGVRNARTFAI